MVKGLSRRRDVTGAGSLELFDLNPILLDGFTLRTRSIEVKGKPKIDQWIAAMQFAHGAAESSPYWWGDLVNYAESRADWAEKMSQALEVSGLTRQTLLNLSSICKRVAPPERRLSPSVAHTDLVAKLPRVEQAEWLERSSVEGWTSRELRIEMRQANRRRVIEGQAVLEGMYRVVYADCPWEYGDRPPSGSGAVEHYDGMTIEALCALPVAAHTLSDAALFFWVPAPLLLQHPGPRDVIEAWGFTAKTGMVWDKVDHNFGNYVSVRHEHLIIATRGSCTPDRLTPMIDSVLTERPGDHSEKPEAFRKVIERLYDGPYLELFGRENHEGWTTFGNDARLWSAEAVAS